MAKPCDLCAAQVADESAMVKVSAKALRRFVDRGFTMGRITWGPTGELIGSLASQKAVVDMVQAQWVRQVMADSTTWFFCTRCHAELAKFDDVPGSGFRFVDPKRFSGFPVHSLKYVFVHVPEKNLDEARVSSDFVAVFRDLVGAELNEVFGHANVTFITGSHAGDEVQRGGGGAPDWVYEGIEKLYPGVKPSGRYWFHGSVFLTEHNHNGLILLVYEAGSKQGLVP